MVQRRDRPAHVRGSRSMIMAGCWHCARRIPTRSMTMVSGANVAGHWSVQSTRLRRRSQNHRWHPATPYCRVERAIDDHRTSAGQRTSAAVDHMIWSAEAARDCRQWQKIPAGTTVAAYPGRHVRSQSFSNPTGSIRRARGALSPLRRRPPPCGRAVNDVQIPELVRQVLKRGIPRVERPRYDGPSSTN